MSEEAEWEFAIKKHCPEWSPADRKKFIAWVIPFQEESRRDSQKWEDEEAERLRRNYLGDLSNGYSHGCMRAAEIMGRRPKKYPSVPPWRRAPSSDDEAYRRGYVIGAALWIYCLMAWADGQLPEEPTEPEWSKKIPATL